VTTASIPKAPFKFTEKRLSDLPAATSSRYSVRDSEQVGLICIVHPAGKAHPEGLKVLQVYRKPKGGNAPIRVKVCNLGELPMTALKGQPSVRSAADDILAKLRKGINPNAEQRAIQAEAKRQQSADDLAGITLAQAFEKYVETKPLRPQTLAGYRRTIDRDLADWQDKPLREITGPMAVTRHAELARSSKSVAMRAMQVLRAVHLFARDFYGTDDNELPFGRCPVDKVNRIARQWSRTAARTRRLGIEDLSPWLHAVRSLPAHQKRSDGDYARIAAYLELMLLTGLRRREAAFMRWADVDLRRGTLTVRETKNRDDHTLPITRRVRELLALRKAADPASEYVIGTAQIQRQLVTIEAQTGIKATPHDLRRTWASIADKAGVGAYGIKRALNHKTTGDVTGTHYAQVDIDDLRALMQKVEDFILRHAEQRDDNIVVLHQGGAAA
jgi:integrase